jgi:hypothetical protein
MPVSRKVIFDVQFGKGGRWAVLLGFVLVIAICIALVVIAASVLLILVPVAAITAAALYLLRRGKPRQGLMPDAPGGGQIIDVEYRVIDKTNTDPKA